MRSSIFSILSAALTLTASLNIGATVAQAAEQELVNCTTPGLGFRHTIQITLSGKNLTARVYETGGYNGASALKATFRNVEGFTEKVSPKLIRRIYRDTETKGAKFTLAPRSTARSPRGGVQLQADVVAEIPRGERIAQVVYCSILLPPTITK